MQCEIRGIMDAAKHSKSSDTMPRSGLVEKVCKEWLVHEDEALAYKLQKKEVEEHYVNNRSRNAQVREDFPKAKDEQQREIEEATKRYNDMIRKQAEIDFSYAQSIEEEENAARLLINDQYGKCDIRDMWRKPLKDPPPPPPLVPKKAPLPDPPKYSQEGRKPPAKFPHHHHLLLEEDDLEKWEFESGGGGEDDDGYLLPASGSRQNVVKSPDEYEKMFPERIHPDSPDLPRHLGRLAMNENREVDASNTRAFLNNYYQGVGGGGGIVAGALSVIRGEGDYNHDIIVSDEETSLSEEVNRKLQEERDEELARRLQEREEEIVQESMLERDRMLAMEAQDMELARMLQQKEKAKLKRARERHRQRAFLKKESYHQRQEEALLEGREEEEEEGAAATVGSGRGEVEEGEDSNSEILPAFDDPNYYTPGDGRFPAASAATANDTLRNVAMAIDPTYFSIGHHLQNSSAPNSISFQDTEAPPYMPIQGQRRTCASLEKKGKKKAKEGCKQQ